MIRLLAGFTMLTMTGFGQGVPHQQLPPRAVNTNGATILGDYSAVPGLPGGPQAPQSSPSTHVDFQGLTDNNVAFPPDTMGAVGTNHVVTILNTQVRIQSRTGTTLQTMTLANFWNSTNIGSFTEVFDPQIVYDPYNNCWIACAVVEHDSSNSSALTRLGKTAIGKEATGLIAGAIIARLPLIR